MPEQTPPHHSRLQEDTLFRIMRILQDNLELTQRAFADKLGMSVDGLNYCLKAFIDKGFVKMTNFQKSKNKFKYFYLLTTQAMAEKVALNSHFMKRKMDQYDVLKVEIEALCAEVGNHQAEGQEMQKA